MTINGSLTHEDIAARLKELEPKLTRENISAKAVRKFAQLVRVNGCCGPLGVLDDILTSPQYDFKEPGGKTDRRLLNARLQALNSMAALYNLGSSPEELGEKYKEYFKPYRLMCYVDLRSFELSNL